VAAWKGGAFLNEVAPTFSTITIASSQPTRESTNRQSRQKLIVKPAMTSEKPAANPRESGRNDGDSTERNEPRKRKITDDNDEQASQLGVVSTSLIASWIYAVDSWEARPFIPGVIEA